MVPRDRDTGHASQERVPAKGAGPATYALMCTLSVVLRVRPNYLSTGPDLHQWGSLWQICDVSSWTWYQTGYQASDRPKGHGLAWTVAKEFAKPTRPSDIHQSSPPWTGWVWIRASLPGQRRLGGQHQGQLQQGSAWLRLRMTMVF